MQLLPESQDNPPDVNAIFKAAAERRLAQRQDAAYPEYLRRQLLDMDYKNQIQAPNAAHAEEITMAALKDKLAEAFMKRAQGGLFGAETNKTNIESKFLPAKSRADIADKLANTNFLRAQTTNELYKNNPILGGYAGLNNFMQDKQIDPRIRGMALGGQLGEHSQGNNNQIPFRGGYRPSNGQVNAPMQGNMGGISGLQAALMTTDQFKEMAEQRKEQAKERGDVNVFKQKEEEKSWNKYYENASKQTEYADKMIGLADSFMDNYKKAHSGAISSTGPLAFLSTNPIFGILASPEGQAANSLSNQMAALYASSEIGSARGQGPLAAGLKMASISKPNLSMKEEAAQEIVDLMKINALAERGHAGFVQNHRNMGEDIHTIDIKWHAHKVKLINKMKAQKGIK